MQHYVHPHNVIAFDFFCVSFFFLLFFFPLLVHSHCCNYYQATQNECNHYFTNNWNISYCVWWLKNKKGPLTQTHRFSEYQSRGICGNGGNSLKMHQTYPIVTMPFADKHTHNILWLPDIELTFFPSILVAFFLQAFFFLL